MQGDLLVRMQSDEYDCLLCLRFATCSEDGLKKLLWIDKAIDSILQVSDSSRPKTRAVALQVYFSDNAFQREASCALCGSRQKLSPGYETVVWNAFLQIPIPSLSIGVNLVWPFLFWNIFSHWNRKTKRISLIDPWCQFWNPSAHPIRIGEIEFSSGRSSIAKILQKAIENECVFSSDVDGFVRGSWRTSSGYGCVWSPEDEVQWASPLQASLHTPQQSQG